MLRFRATGLFLVSVALVVLAAVPADARTWPVKSTMTRAEIQQVFDLAKDGDRIQFHRGVYDFSDGPFVPMGTNSGAIVITDKSLTVVGLNGAVIKGRAGDPDTGGVEDSGIAAFRIINPDQTKDVTFENLTFETFMVGIAAYCESVYPPLAFNLHSVTIRDCTFRDIRRNAIVVLLNSGSTTIVNNKIEEARQAGLYINWEFAYDGSQHWQADGTLVDISSNFIRAGTAAIFLICPTKIRIVGNTLEGLDTRHAVGLGIGGLKTEGLIADNIIRHFSYGMELSAGWVHATLSEEFQRAVIRGNTLSDIFIVGIFIEGGLPHDNVVEGNAVDMNPGSWGAISTDGYNNRFLDNILTGWSNQAVFLTYWDNTPNHGPIDAAHNEYFEANSVAGLTPDFSHYRLDPGTHDNIIEGICAENATYSDYGVNNVITCLFSSESISRALSRRSVQSARMGTRPRIDW